MSSGAKFLTKKSDVFELTVDRMHIVEAVAQYLNSLSLVKNDITNIQFSNLFGASTTEYVTLKIYTKTPNGVGTNGGEHKSSEA